MAMSDIEKIIEAESAAEKLRAQTSDKIKKLLSSAETEGSVIYATAVNRGEAEAEKIRKISSDKITAASKKSTEKAAKRAEEIKAAASGNIEKAAQIICERVIKG